MKQTSKNKALSYSIIIPAYNEEAYIAQTLSKLQKFLKDKKMSNITEVIVIVSGKDNTAAIVKSYENKIVNLRMLNFSGQRVHKGEGVKRGVKVAYGSKLLFMDADGATPLKYIPEAFELLDAHEVVIGSRDLQKMHDSLARKITSVLSHTAITVLAVAGISDTQCGFKAYTSDSAKKLYRQQRISGWGFDFENLALARKYGYSIYELAIPDWKDPKGDNGLVGDNQTAAMIKTLKELITVRINLIRGVYEKS